MAIKSSKKTLHQILNIKSEESENNNFVGVEFDSRNIRGGELFVALAGEQTHGNNFVSTAFERGASLALAEKGEFPDEFKDSVIIVDDSLKSFSDVSRWWRKEINLPLAAVTGSVGKTTVKEMLASILLQWGSGCYSKKSFNNHVGVPYTLCQIGREHKWAVIEMGMNHEGELRTLTKIASPNVVTITKIAPAHIEYFGTLEAIARAKLEILEGLTADGKIILNGDDTVLMGEYKKLSRDKDNVYTFGSGADATLRLQNIKSALLDGITFEICHEKVVYPVKMKIIGQHHAYNAACAALTAKTLIPEISFETIIKGLERFSAPLMRMSVKNLANGSVLVDDSYNANLESMSALLSVAKELKDSGKKIGLIVGDMLELGEFSATAHSKIADLIVKIIPDFCLCVGKESKAIYDKLLTASINTLHFYTVQEIKVESIKDSFDVLLIKASRGIALDLVVDKVINKYGIKI